MIDRLQAVCETIGEILIKEGKDICSLIDESVLIMPAMEDKCFSVIDDPIYTRELVYPDCVQIDSLRPVHDRIGDVIIKEVEGAWKHFQEAKTGGGRASKSKIRKLLQAPPTIQNQIININFTHSGRILNLKSTEELDAPGFP